MQLQQIERNGKSLRVLKNGSDKVIIFSHGFGVKWDSRGLFTEISDSLPGYDFIFFDYAKVDNERNTTLEDLNDQFISFENALQTAINLKYSEINIISHSFGIVIPAKLNSSLINKFVMLAPAKYIDKEKQLESLYKKEGAVIDLKGYSSFARSDGTKTFVNHTFYDSIEGLNIFDYLKDLKAKEQYLIIAKQDEIITDNYSKNELPDNIILIEVDGDHNFKGEDRAGLIEKLKEIF